MTAVLALEVDFAAAQIATQKRFDAARPACPRWCDRSCETDGHFGDAVIHTQAPAEVSSVADWNHVHNASVSVKAWRHDSLDETSVTAVIVDVSRAETATGDHAVLTANQARQLAAQLIQSADLVDPAGGVR